MAHCRKTQLSIFLTTRCNLRCIYCYAGSKTHYPIPPVIDLNFVKRGIEDFFGKYESREIRFFGIGEPTVAFREMKEIKEWVFEKTDGNCLFELQTNGYFPRTIAEWIAENIDIVWISCDGPPDIQNLYRPTLGGRPTSDVLENNIRFLVSKSVMVSCRATIGTINLGRQDEMIRYFAGLGVKAVMSDPIFEPVENREGLSAELREVDLMEYAKYFLEARQVAEKLGVFYGSIFTVNFDEKTEYFCRACIPYPHLTTDGFVTCCDMAYTGADPKMKQLVYGKYIPKEDRVEYDEDAIKRIQSRKASNMPHCQSCEVLQNCAGACLGEAVNETGDMFGIKPKVCEAIRYLAKHTPLNKGLYPYLHP